MLKKLSMLLCACLLLMTGCSSLFNSVSSVKEAEQLNMPKDGEEIAIMKTNKGDIKIRLFPKAAPKAVENFTTHAKDGYYNGQVFHRVINDFMIQGGDPTGTGAGGESIWKKPFEDEFLTGYHNLRGSLSMANAGAGTNGSQFFIVQAKTVDEDMLSQMSALNKKGESKGMFPDAIIEAYRENGGTPWLDYRHTVFGHVFEGMDIVDSIASVETDENDKPVEDVIINEIKIVKYEEPKK